MELITKPHPWSCLAASFSMALGIPVKTFHDLAGHDGSEKIWPELPEPLCRRGFHISEATMVCLLLRASATPLELFPVTAVSPMAPYHGTEQFQVHYPPKFSEAHNWELFCFYIDHGQGVIECRTRNGNWHAVAYERGVIYDPDGRHFGYSREACEARGLFTTRLWKVANA